MINFFDFHHLFIFLSCLFYYKIFLILLNFIFSFIMLNFFDVCSIISSNVSFNSDICDCNIWNLVFFSNIFDEFNLSDKQFNLSFDLFYFDLIYINL
jgi:hypothetical protein